MRTIAKKRRIVAVNESKVRQVANGWALMGRMQHRDLSK